MNALTILLIDDEEVQLASLKSFLSRRDHTVLTAVNGRIGLELVKENVVDLILTDFRMPEMNGREVLDEVKKINPEMVATIGYLQVKPGAANVIPGNCEFIVEMRSQNGNDLNVLSDMILDYVEHYKGFSAKVIYDKKQTRLNSTMIDTICNAAEIENKSYVKMPSGAGHDAQTFAVTVPSGMIFIPCKEGISHNPDEWADKKDVANGCDVLLRTVLMLTDIG